MKSKLLVLVLLLTQTSFAQGDFIDSLSKRRPSLSKEHFLSEAAKIPFEQISSNPSKSTHFLESILHDTGLHPSPEVRSSIYNSLATSTYYEGKYDASLDYNLKAIKLYEQLHDSVHLGDTYASLGHQIKRRDLKKGIYYMNKGINILRQTHAPVELSRACNNFGVLHMMNQDLDSALLYFSEGLDLARERNDSLAIPYSLINISFAYMEQGKYELVLQNLNEAYAIRKVRNDRNGIAESLTNFGEYYAHIKDYPKAIAAYKEGLSIAEEIKYKGLAQYTAFELSRCYEQTGDLQQALQYLRKAEEIEDELINTQTNDRIAALEVQFDTERKEKELAEHKALLNQQKVRETRKNYLLIGLGIVLLLLIVLGFVLIRQYRYKQARLRSEHQLKEQLAEEQLKNKLYAERQRISRDLHDNIGSQLSFLTSSMDNLRYVSSEQRVNSKLDELSDFTRETITKLRDTIWAMNSETLTAVEFDNRLIAFLDKLRGLLPNRQIVYRPSIDAPAIQFTPTQGISLFRIVQESINNAIKYADFDLLEVELGINAQSLRLRVTDNGKGFDLNQESAGDGLKNMHYRAQDAGGKVEITSAPGQGTSVCFTIEMP